MECKIKVFAESVENYNSRTSKCYLIGMNLLDYLENLPVDYREYDIQRGIVKNTYLDSIAEDIIKGAHLPIITLTASKVELDHITNYRILDGLQRTFRVHQLYRFLQQILTLPDIFEIVDDKREFRNKYRNDWKLSENYTYSVLEARRIIEALRKFRSDLLPKDLLKIFDVEQWFEVWENLSREDEIRKMIVLNAGHKPMNNYHQLELLFLNQLSYIKNTFPNIEIIRGKDKSTLEYGKSREKNQYYFAHIIETMLSYIDKKPVTLNSSLIQAVQEGEDAALLIQKENNIVFETIEFLIELDNYLYEKYGDNGIKWISKDTVLTAIVATLGQKEMNYKEFIDLLRKNNGSLNIEGFNEWRSSLNISNINIGKHTKNTVMAGITSLIENPGIEINWGRYSGGMDE